MTPEQRKAMLKSSTSKHMKASIMWSSVGDEKRSHGARQWWGQLYTWLQKEHANRDMAASISLPDIHLLLLLSLQYKVPCTSRLISRVCMDVKFHDWKTVIEIYSKSLVVCHIFNVKFNRQNWRISMHCIVTAIKQSVSERLWSVKWTIKRYVPTWHWQYRVKDVRIYC